MRFVFNIALAFVVAVTTGVGSAWLAADHAPLFDAMRVGAWTAWPRAGSIDADPYDLAALARVATLPLGSGEGLEFRAETDDTGAPLDGNCVYEIAGQTPPARLWTLTAYDARGTLMPGPGRSSVQSRDVLRRPDGSFVIVVAPDVQPGNWLPVAASAKFALVFRLYDTPLTSTARPTTVAMPIIRRVACP